jgi:hypothetical protein
MKIINDLKHSNDFAFLIGKKISSVRYMSKVEADHFGWHKRPLIIRFTDGTFLLPQSDDEGNDGGAMYYNDGNLEQQKTIYTI